VEVLGLLDVERLSFVFGLLLRWIELLVWTVAIRKHACQIVGYQVVVSYMWKFGLW
jgi:hypothetical protein